MTRTSYTETKRFVWTCTHSSNAVCPDMVYTVGLVPQLVLDP